jgi:hypothetical protein
MMTCTNKVVNKFIFHSISPNRFATVAKEFLNNGRSSNSLRHQVKTEKDE